MAGQRAASERKASMMDRVRSLMMFGLVLGVVGAAHAYIGARILAGLGASGAVAVAGWAAVGALFLLLPAGLLAGGLRTQRLAFSLRWAGYLWMGLFCLLLSAVTLVDLGAAAGRLVGLGEGGWGRLEVLAVAGMVVPAFVWGLKSAAGPARIERLAVPISGLGAGLAGLRIVQLSDLHLGGILGADFACRVVEQVNALEPDVVAITGDLVDGSVARLRDEVRPLTGLRARHGVYFVIGNHECYCGAAAWERELGRMGFEVLHNEHRVIERGGASLVIAGVTDHDAGGLGDDFASRPDLALEGAPDGVPRILLAHQPRSAFAAAGHRIALQLSGHTHAGQLFPWMFFVRLQQPVVRGLRWVAGVRVYTHRGTGFWGPPLRVGAPPEIAEITLTAASPSP